MRSNVLQFLAADALQAEPMSVEEHDNVPDFREHDVWLDCDECRAEWRFVDGKSVRQWGLELVTSDATI